MQDQNNMQTLIYKYLLTRIHYGFYPKGKPLPSIYHFSNMFNVSTMTIRCAYKRLEKEGYITISKNRRPYITHKPHPDTEFPIKDLASKESLQDLLQSLSLLLPSIFWQGFLCCGEEDRKNLYEILERSNYDWEEPAFCFLTYITNKIGNPLLDDFFFDVMLYSYPSFLSSMFSNPKGRDFSYNLLYKNLRHLLAVQEKGDKDELWRCILEYYWNYDVASISALSSTSGTPYHWNKMQLTNSISSNIIHRIFSGKYPMNQFLPSAAKMAEEFSVPAITMRRSIALLNQLGMTESINGRGTRVIPQSKRFSKINWENPVLRSNILSYLHALQILALTGHRVAKSVFSSLSKDELKTFKEWILYSKEIQTPFPSVAACLKLLTQSNKFSALGEIYSSLVNFLVWGHPLSYIEPQTRTDTFAANLLSIIDSCDSQRFADEFEKIMYYLFSSSKKKSIALGIKEAAALDLRIQ